VNQLKLRHPLLQGEGVLSVPAGLDGDVLLLERRAEQGGDLRGWVAVNRSEREPARFQLSGGVGDRSRLYRVCRDDAADEGEAPGDEIVLAGAEVAYLLPDA